MGYLQPPATVHGLALRCVTGSEIPAIGAMWDRCSLATRIARFHAPVKDIPSSYLDAVLSDPGANVLAAREPTGDVVALGSLIRDPGSAIAELGVLVEDAWQRRGIGRRLVARLISAAPARGITTLTASIRPGTPWVAGLLRQVPGQFSVASDGEVLTVRVHLASIAEDPCSRSSPAPPARSSRKARGGGDRGRQGVVDIHPSRVRHRFLRAPRIGRDAAPVSPVGARSVLARCTALGGGA